MEIGVWIEGKAATQGAGMGLLLCIGWSWAVCVCVCYYELGHAYIPPLPDFLNRYHAGTSYCSTTHKGSKKSPPSKNDNPTKTPL